MSQTLRASQFNDSVQQHMRRNFTTLSPEQTVAQALDFVPKT